MNLFKHFTAKRLSALLITIPLLLTTGCGSTQPGSGSKAGQESGENPAALVYGSGDYTRINPAMDEHGEINILIFDGLTAHNGRNEVVPALAKDWEFDDSSYTYTFHLEEGVTWHDGTAFSADDVAFTIEAIMNPENGSENAPDYEDVKKITVIDEHTISFKLSAPNAAFLDYMSMPILPKHLLEGEDMQTSDFFRSPVGTGPYKLERWDEGQAITLVKNDSYFKGAADIDSIIFKIVTDDNVRAVQMQSGGRGIALF